MSKVFSPMTIRHITLANRIVMPPMVMFAFGREDGNPTEENAMHYAKRARGRVGLIIVEATCVNSDGKLHKGQLGLWEDAQIEGHQRIVDAVHVYDRPILVQLHHAGLKAIVPQPLSSSDVETEQKGKIVHARAMTTDQVQTCIGDFADAARRAYHAGYDGVELHGAHGYLLSQFLSESVNKRTDAYGGSLANRTRIVCEIIQKIREECGEDFIIGIRIGFNEPDAESSGQIIRLLEQSGLDLCHISSGYQSIDAAFSTPQDFPFSKRVYGAKLVREYTKVSLISVGEVPDVATADAILAAGISDLVAIGRGLLADEDIVFKAEQGQPQSAYTCLRCKPCRYYDDATQCPQQLRAKREKA